MISLLNHGFVLLALVCAHAVNPAAAGVTPSESNNPAAAPPIRPLNEAPDHLFWHLWQHNNTANVNLTSNLSATFHGKWAQVIYQSELDSAAVPHKQAGLVQITLQLKPGAAAGVSTVQGDLTIHDGLDLLGLDFRMKLSGMYVDQSNRLHASVEPFLPIRIRNPNPPEAHPSAPVNNTIFESDLPRDFNDAASLEAAYLKSLRDAAEQYNRNGGVAWALQRAITRSMLRCSLRLELEALPPLDPPALPVQGQPHDAHHQGGGVRLVGALFSDNCNMSWSMEAASLEHDKLRSRATHYSWLVAAVAGVQIVLVLRQMEAATASPTAAARLSLLTVSVQALIDAYLCLLHLTFALVADSLFTQFAIVAFFQFVLFALLEMRLIVVTWRASREPPADIWAAHRELSTLYTRFYGVLLVGIFLAYQMHRYGPLLLLLLHSWWLPQVYHSALHSARQPLQPAYILGISATRLVLPLYFFGCPSNLLSIPPSPTFCAVLVAWVSLQAALLLCQHRFGPRSVVPKVLLPPRYEYFRAATKRELGLGAGASAPDVETGHGSRECVICMNPVEVARPSSRMITPCGHFFHPQCLQRWMDVKMECPTCRSALPPP